MPKNHHLPQLLLFAFICIHLHTVGNPIRASFNSRDQFAIVSRSTKKDLVKRIYDSQVGIREQGNNSGLAVEKYLKYTGLAKGNPWCAAFVCWVYGQAGIVNPRTGWSPSLFTNRSIIWDRGKLRTRFARTPAPPCRADIFAIYFPNKGRIAHTGFIDSWDGHWLTTVEGNTNMAGNREGDGVYRKRRMVKSVYQVARYVNSLNDE